MPKSPSFIATIVTITILILTLLFLRLLYILPATNPRRPLPRKRGSPTHLLIVLGSGGHTAEMFALLADLDPISYNHRTYVVSRGDEFSALRAEAFEAELATKNSRTSKIFQNPPSSSPSFSSTSPPLSQPQPPNQTPPPQKHHHPDALFPPSSSSSSSSSSPPYTIHTIPRARQIHQPLLTTPLSSFKTLLASISLLTSPSPSPPSSSSSPSSLSPSSSTTYPDLILLNGPATSAIFLLAALTVRFCDWRGTTRGKMRSIYIESWARVKSLSLSARVVVAVGGAERVLVQWEGLKGKGEFRGCLIG